MQVSRPVKTTGSLPYQLNTLNLATRIRHWYSNFLLSMNRSSTVVEATWSCLAVELIRRNLVVIHHTGKQSLFVFQRELIFVVNVTDLWRGCMQYHVWSRYLWLQHQESSCYPYIQWQKPLDRKGCSLWDWPADSCLYIHSSSRCYLHHPHWQCGEAIW